MQALASRQSAFVASSVAPVRRAAMAPVRMVTVEVQAGTGGKLKTRKACAKRYKVTGSGKVMARHAGKQHFNEKMPRADIREQSQMFTLSKGDLNNAMKCLPNSGIKTKGH